MTDALAINLARALRGRMRPAGPPPKCNPDISDRWDQAEHTYRITTGSTYQGPLPGVCSFTFNGRPVMFDHIYPHLITAQELHQKRRKRSPAAIALTECLHADAFYPHFALAAKPKLLEIHERIRQ